MHGRRCTESVTNVSTYRGSLAPPNMSRSPVLTETNLFFLILSSRPLLHQTNCFGMKTSVSGTTSWCYETLCSLSVLCSSPPPPPAFSPLSTNWLNVSVSGALNCLLSVDPGGRCRASSLHLTRFPFFFIFYCKQIVV